MTGREDIPAETTSPPTAATAEVHVISRENKLARLRERGIDPYPPRFFRTCDNAAAVATFTAIEAGAAARVRR